MTTAHEMPLSSAQSGVWFAHHLRPGSSVYNTGEYLDIPGPVDGELFERALRRVVDETESLRVRFTVGPDGPRQVLSPAPDWPMHHVDLTSAPDPRRAAEEWMRTDLSTPVELTRGPLFCQALFKIAPDRFLWYQRVHHIVVDGFSMSLLARRVAKTYTGLVAGSDRSGAAFGPLSLLLEDDSSYHASEQRERDRAFWTERLAGRPDPVSLASRSAPASDSFLRRTSSLSASAVAALRRAGQHAGSSWPTAMIAVIAAYLHRLSGERDVVLSMPVTGRMGSSGRTVPGMVANVVPLRLRVRPEHGLSALVRQTADEIGALREHQRYRSEDLRRELGRELGPGQSERALFGPVANIMSFYYHVEFAGLRATAHNLSNGPVEDLSISVYDRSDGTEPRVDFDANPALYSDAELTAHQERFLRFLDAVVTADPAQPIGRPDILTPGERHRTVVERNRTTHPLPPTTLPRAFAAVVARTPDATAVVFGDTVLSYAELNARANRLAHRLIAMGVRGESTVAVLMERSADVVVSVLAISKAGGAYVPLDTRSPVARLRLVMGETGAAVLLTHRAAGNPELSRDTPTVVVDSDPGLAEEPAVDPVVAPRPENLACVLYTSGSTGTPKGVALSHRNVASLTAQRCWRSEDGPRVLAHSPHAFDASTYEWWVPLLNGGQVVMAPPGELDLASYHRLIADHRVSALWLTAGLFRVIAEESPGCLAQVGEVWTGGDIVPADAVRRVLERCPDTAVIAGYGPTEATTFTTRSVLYPGRAVPDVVPIGRPMDNRRVYVLDETLSPVPPGVAGVLYIAGPGLARGYLNSPRWTAQQFLPCPFGGPGERMYRTGDVVRWNSDDELEFLGRADEQVKLHGFRIELGEIEAVLAEHPGVAQATVVAGPNASGDKRLIGYVVPTGGSGPDAASLREHIAAALPDYMVPSAFVTLDGFPLTRNGKIDRTALPVPDSAPAASAQRPGTPAEDAMCALFAEVLNRSPVGVDDGFFALGGDSLLATRLINRVRVRFGRELTLGALFQAPTPARLAEALDSAPDSAAVPDLARRTTAQTAITGSSS
ncbi:non-ribosomal peptide synthetase [Streptomyces jumonjinensis]|uniref:Amino acid adenylation domain-containing protein n=1 Tax=Streptomyces jumonjinensis TaxID=1945 RepID=A0A646KI87_STRJU|nr:non-ribosomal peptide synthetase [Streptomyces jumonjinensis]MQT01717.1 amino acid adenylation domain-containing protein [Streptomyces jumonjinensis]